MVDQRDGAADAGTTNKVSDAPINASLFNIKGHGSVGQPWGPFIIGCFDDSNPKSTMGDFSASIDWGDGSSTKNLAISKASGNCKTLGWRYAVSAPAHTFAKAKTYTYTYKVVSAGGSKDQSTGQIVIK